MNVIINDNICASSVGQTLGKSARLNHSHVGYICGGHGVCQACYVTVQEGADCLAPLTDVEKAFLSPRQIAAGGRMACQATIAKEGTVKVLSRPEEVRRMFFSNPLALFAYGAEMGRDIVQQIVPGIGNLVGRIVKGEMDSKDALGDLMESIRGAFGLAVETIPEYFPFKEQVKGIAGKLPIQLPFTTQNPTESVIEKVKLSLPAPKA
ncbi:MAG: 2Fe-2S iron-sulfur cluster-binding protein [Chlorobiaceae bacterium]